MQKKINHTDYISRQNGKYASLSQNSGGKKLLNTINNNPENGIMGALQIDPLHPMSLSLVPKIPELVNFYTNNGEISIAIPSKEKFILNIFDPSKNDDMDNLENKMKIADKFEKVGLTVGIASLIPAGIFTAVGVAKNLALLGIIGGFGFLGLGLIGLTAFFIAMYKDSQYNKELQRLKDNLPIISFSKDLSDLAKEYEELIDKNTPEAIKIKHKIEKIRLVDELIIECMVCTLGLIHHGNTTYDWNLEDDVTKNWKIGVLKMEKLIKYLNEKFQMEIKDGKMDIKDINKVILDDKININDLKTCITRVNDMDIQNVNINTEKTPRNSTETKNTYSPYNQNECEIQQAVKTSNNFLIDSFVPSHNGIGI
jgi:hypothetical protein